MDQEKKVEYRDIKGLEGLYQIGSDGSVLKIGRCKKPHLLTTFSYTEKGYLRINVCINGKNKRYRIHRLVAQAFIPNPENKPQVNHIDGNKQNNCVGNLEWVTDEENKKHATENGLVVSKPVVLYINGNLILHTKSVNEMKKATGVSAGRILQIINKEFESVLDFRWADFQ